MTRLSESEVQSKLAQLPGWQLQDGKLQRTYKFPDFVEAMAFVKRLAFLAEEAGHHPDIDIRYNNVVLGLVTHDAGGITGSDVTMAAKINALD
jgi:4a-hydroxytetrahydrobiopterin dehydratase